MTKKQYIDLIIDEATSYQLEALKEASSRSIIGFCIKLREIYKDAYCIAVDSWPRSYLPKISDLMEKLDELNR